MRSWSIYIGFALCLVVWIGVLLLILALIDLRGLADTTPALSTSQVLLSPAGLLLLGLLAVLTAVLIAIWRQAK
jgi:hypothetical protein